MEINRGVEQLIKPHPPIGEARKLDEIVSKNWQEHLLLFSQVENEVLEVNPAFEGTLPFKLEKGKSSPLGLFAEAVFEQKPSELPAGKQALEFWPKHRRSAILGRAIFADKAGGLYRDVDLKGVGHLGYPGKVLALRKDKYISGGYTGLLGRDTAFLDYYLSEDFFREGIRIARVLGIIELKELINKGKKLSLKEAVEIGIIDDDFFPTIEVRAFTTKLRIDDAHTSGSEERQLLIEDAKKLVSQELGRQKTLSNKEYSEWFVKTLGCNVGMMHKNGWLHNYIGAHNITLDCRIVDLDGVSELRNNKQRLEDIKTSWNATGLLAAMLESVDDSKLKDLKRQFRKSYNAVFSSKEREEYFKKFKKISKNIK